MYDWPWPLRAAAGVFTLLEGHVARTVHVSRPSYVTESIFLTQRGCRLGPIPVLRLKTRVKKPTANKEIVPLRHIIHYCGFVFSGTEHPGSVYLSLRFKRIHSENVDVSPSTTNQIQKLCRLHSCHDLFYISCYQEICQISILI